MSRVLVFSARGDDALANAGHVADWTIARLVAEGHVLTSVAGADATRLGLEAGLHQVDGLAAFSHGRADALLDASRAAVLDERNAALLTGRWGWFYACHTGHDLPAILLDAGATCFAGFDVPVIVEWDLDDLPDAIRATFVQLVTEVPSHLAADRRDRVRVQQAIVPLVDTILDYYEDNPDATGGFEISAQQMLHRLVLLP